MSYIKKLVLVPKKWILRNWFSYSLFQSKGPFYDVLTGRRDSRRSMIFDVIGNLPPPTSNFANLTILFASRGLTVKDLVALSGIIRVHIWDAICYPDSDDCFSFPRQGGHTIGTSHCSSFANRLYDPSGRDIDDPTLDSEYVPKLKSKCKPNDTTTLVEMDPGSHKTFDSSFFKLVAKRRSLLTSDHALLTNAQAKELVMRFASSQSEFFREYGVSMVRMGNIGVLTGTKGEIRKKCAVVN